MTANVAQRSSQPKGAAVGNGQRPMDRTYFCTQVAGLSRAITDQDKANGPELLASVNPTFTWVRLAQRIPVRICITNVPAGVLMQRE
jgi:multidrug resistance efflux pump